MEDKNETLIFLDSETGGLDPTIHPLLSVAMVNGTTGETFLVEICPTKDQWDQCSPEALRVNGLTYEHLKEHGVALPQARLQFISWLHKQMAQGPIRLVGQNVNFDLGYWLHNFGQELSFLGVPLNNAINVIDVFKRVQRLDRTLITQKYNGKAISLALGVKPEPDVHLALEGALVVLRNYMALVEREGKSRPKQRSIV